MYCAKCGVRLEQGSLSCPLCGFKVPDELQSKEIRNRYPQARTTYEQRIEQKKNRWGVLISIFFLLLILTLLFSNLHQAHFLTWGIPTGASLLLAWILILLAIFYRKGQEYRLLSYAFFTFIFFFMLLNSRGDLNSAALFVEIWTIFLIYIGAMGSVFARKKLGKGKLFLLLAFYALIIEFFLLCLDMLLHCYLWDKLAVTFSLYTLIPLGGVSFLFLYLHFDMAEEIRESVRKKWHF